jgi:hypothetical protein
MSIRAIAVYIVVGFVFAAIGLLWWQTAIVLITVQLAEAALNEWEKS